MPASQFFEKLPILKDGNKQVGVCAMGPVGTGDELIWMLAWFWQQRGKKVAAASGKAGTQVLGAQKLKNPKDYPPFALPQKKSWMVQAALEEGSAKFTDQKPAFVEAIALIENDGERRILQWNQAVLLYEPKTPGGGYGRGPGPR